MEIIGVDYHSGDQYIEFVDIQTGECAWRIPPVSGASLEEIPGVLL